MLTLGFTNHFYTLWSVTQSIRYGRGAVVNGVFTGEMYQVTNYQYRQNLSMDFEAAKEKIALYAGEAGYEIDLDLRGEHGSFEKTVRMINNYAQWQFTFGKLSGCDIRTSEDAWQLKRAMNSEVGGRRRVYARRRLIELGELIRYDWIENKYDYEATMQRFTDLNIDARNLTPEQERELDVWYVINRKYTTPKHAAILEMKKNEAALNGHFYQNGARINIEVKRVGGFSFDSQYGVTYVEKYLTKDGKMVKYMGSARPSIPEDKFVLITGTVKHSDYKGQPETKLQRIKL